MSTGVRLRLSTLGAATALSAAMVLGAAGTASAEPVAQPALAAAAVPVAVTPAAFVTADPSWNRHRRCHREFHRGGWWGGWDRWHHGRGHFRPGWWSFSCR